MKKITILLSTAMLLFASATMAQRNFSPEKQKAMYKDSLGVNDALADSLVAIDGRYREKMMAMRQSGGGDRDVMMSQMKTLQEQKDADLKKLLPADIYTKYHEMEDRRRAQMRNRAGGGQGFGGNN